MKVQVFFDDYIQFKTRGMFISLINPYFQNDENFKNHLLVNVTQLARINRLEILKFLIKNGKIDDKLSTVNLVSVNPRNFYLDVLMTKNHDIFYDIDSIDQQQHYKMLRLFKMPLTFQIILPDTQAEITCNQDNINMSLFTIIQKIGQGTYAELFLIQRRYDRMLLCLKRINKAECRAKGNLEMISNQYAILEYSSKYKVKLYYQFQDARYVYFVIEYCVFGDLYSIIKNNKKLDENQKLNNHEKYAIWIQIAFGLVSLHERGLIYRDLKPENILINQDGNVKICDFGFACKISQDQQLKQLCGSYQYLAPEIIRKQGYNKSLDLYCLGLLLYELLVGTNPYEGTTPQNIQEMKARPINYEKKNINQTVKDLIKKLLKDKPQERLGYQSSFQLFKHDFFKENEDLIIKIIGNKLILRNLKYIHPVKIAERKQLDEKQVYIFPKYRGYNYLKPNFDVTENVGPKFYFTQ